MKSTAKPDSETKAGGFKASDAAVVTCIWTPSMAHRRPNRKLGLLSGLLSKVFPCYPKEPFFFSSTAGLNPKTRKPPISNPSTFQTEISASPWEADNSDRQHALWRHTYWPQVPDWPLTSCMTLNKLLNLLESCSSPAISTQLKNLLGGLKERIQVPLLEQDAALFILSSKASLPPSVKNVSRRDTKSLKLVAAKKGWDKREYFGIKNIRILRSSLNIHT